MGNIRKAWKDAKAMQERSGCGVQPEENEEWVNEVLERKCPFVWRFEEIWGSRPNATVIFNTESLITSQSQHHKFNIMPASTGITR